MNVLFMTIGKWMILKNIQYIAIYYAIFVMPDILYIQLVHMKKEQDFRLRMKEKNGIHMLHVRTGNVTGMVSLIEKGLAQLSIEPIFIKAIKKYYSNVKFDLVMYSTPPITFCNAIEYVKRRDNAKTYLLLKDIFLRML